MNNWRLSTLYSRLLLATFLDCYYSNLRASL